MNLNTYKNINIVGDVKSADNKQYAPGKYGDVLT